MQRIYEKYAYGAEPLKSCYWTQTVSPLSFASLTNNIKCDMLVIGAGFTGLNAALSATKLGLDVVIVDADCIPFGASGRNGGFCCLGGGKISNASLKRRVGIDGQQAYRHCEHQAVEHVQSLLSEYNIDVDQTSNGETMLAHRAKDAVELRNDIQSIIDDYGVTPIYHTREELYRMGMAGPFFGGLTIPIGFGLNPRKYHAGLCNALKSMGVKIYENTPILKLEEKNNCVLASSTSSTITANKVILATNGYASEDIPPWMAGRFMPVQSSVIVTRPLSEQEMQEAGWTTTQIAYDTRNLLHYFRKLPNNRFLFGMRGGLFANVASNAKLQKQIIKDFHQMFPAWGNVDITHMWSGLVCLNRSLAPFAGPVPTFQNIYTGFGYHGNGVAMGSYVGAKLAQMAIGIESKLPEIMTAIPQKFPLGRYRRHILRPIYKYFEWIDR